MAPAQALPAVPFVAFASRWRGPLVGHTMRRFALPPHDAEDLAQEALLRVWLRWNAGCVTAGWRYSLAALQSARADASRAARTAKRSAPTASLTFPATLRAVDADPATWQPSAEAEMLDRQGIRRLAAALADLTPDQRRTVGAVLAEQKGLRPALSDAQKKLLGRARVQLRRRLVEA